jgi:hypothetical protein
MVCAWPEPPFARPAAPSAGVCDGREALASCTSERHTASRTRVTQIGGLHSLIQIKDLWPRCGLVRPKGQQPCFGRLQQESNNDQIICCCLRTGLGVIGAGHAPGTPPTAGKDGHSSPRSMRTGYAPHCEWCLHQNSHSTCRQQVRSWSDLLTSRGRREAAFLFSRWMSEFGPIETCRRMLQMSVCRGRPEVIGVRSERRF